MLNLNLNDELAQSMTPEQKRATAIVCAVIAVAWVAAAIAVYWSANPTRTGLSIAGTSLLILMGLNLVGLFRFSWGLAILLGVGIVLGLSPIIVLIAAISWVVQRLKGSPQTSTTAQD